MSLAHLLPLALAWIQICPTQQQSAFLRGVARQPNDTVTESRIVTSRALTEKSCADTHAWTNGWSRCWYIEDKHEWDGCTPTGWTCEGYRNRGWCIDGQLIGPSLEFGSGYRGNYPELNCCECGAKLAPTPVDGTIRTKLAFVTHPDKCLDVYHHIDRNGNNIQVWDCHDGDSQDFLIPEFGYGPIRWARDPTKCLDVDTFWNPLGDNLQLWTCDVPGRDYDFSSPDNASRIDWARHNNRCLHVKNGNFQNGNNIQISDCDDTNDDQLFNATAWLGED